MILDLQSTDDPRDMVHRTVQALVEGHVVGVPTETVYCLAANALSAESIERLWDLIGAETKLPNRGRGSGPASGESGGSPVLTVSLRSREAAGDFMTPVSPLTRRLMRRCWPGPLTLVTAVSRDRSAVAEFPEQVQSRIMDRDSRIAFRVSQHRILSHLHRYLSAPLILASASVVGTRSPTTVAGVGKSISERLPLLLDDGPTRYGGESTVVRVSGRQWEVQQEGVIERAAMNQFVKPVIALVCTGNTCRSPMAETLLRERLRKKIGCEDAIRVISAGVAAAEGAGATPQAIEVMGQRGLDLTGHSSRPLDESVLNVADLVLTMTRGHRAAILAAWPDMQDHVFTLRRDGGDIHDPVGMPVEAYHACSDEIDAELAKWVDALGDDFFPSPSSDPQ